MYTYYCYAVYNENERSTYIRRYLYCGFDFSWYKETKTLQKEKGCKMYKLSFLKLTLNEMDKQLHMKAHYIVMNNTPVHTHESIERYIKQPKYKYMYLLTYSPKLTLWNKSAQWQRANLSAVEFCKKTLYQKNYKSLQQVLG